MLLVAPTSSATLLLLSTPWRVPSRAPLSPLISTAHPASLPLAAAFLCPPNPRFSAAPFTPSRGARAKKQRRGGGQWRESAPSRGSTGRRGEERRPRAKARSFNSASRFASKKICLTILKFWYCTPKFYGF